MEKKERRWCNVVARVEIMIEVPPGTTVTPAEFGKHLESGMWRHVSDIREISEHIEKV